MAPWQQVLHFRGSSGKAVPWQQVLRFRGSTYKTISWQQPENYFDAARTTSLYKYLLIVAPRGFGKIYFFGLHAKKLFFAISANAARGQQNAGTSAPAQFVPKKFFSVWQVSCQKWPLPEEGPERPYALMETLAGLKGTALMPRPLATHERRALTASGLVLNA